MTFAKTLISALLAAALLTALSACQKPEGPAEKAGKEVDKATQSLGQQIEKAGVDIQNDAKGDKK